MKKTPIIIITKDNPEYLYVTLKSLTASKLYNNPILIIDNNSELDFTKGFYYSMNEYDVSFDDWTSESKNSQEMLDKAFSKTFLSIPFIESIKGLKRKFQIVSTPKTLEPNKILLYAMKTAFTIFPEADYCCILNDSLLFNPNWLKKTHEIYNDERFHTKVGIISVYSEKRSVPEYEYRLDPGYFRGKMMFINKNLYKEMTYVGWFKPNVKVPNNDVNYIELEKIANTLGYITITTENSYIQSIEKRHLSNEHKILKFHQNFKNPVSWNDEM